MKMKQEYLFSYQLQGVSSQAELMESIKRFGVSAQDLMNQVTKKIKIEKITYTLIFTKISWPYQNVP